MKTLAIIQGRMNSSRFPGKILADLQGAPVLSWVYRRALQAESVDHVIFATSLEETDQPAASECARLGIPVFRGSLDDVLDRFYQVALAFRPESIVRITADCPLIDPHWIDQVVTRRVEKDADYSWNAGPPTLPDGLDVEAFSFASLEQAWKNAVKPSEREHVTRYIRAEENGFSMVNVEVGGGNDYSDLRWTVDHPQDLELVSEMMSRVSDPLTADWKDYLSLVEEDSSLRDWNGETVRGEGTVPSRRRDAEAEGTGPRLYERAKEIIPGGTQLLSKRPEMFLPDQWPSYYSRAKGCEVWDLDGNRFLDFSHNGIGTCALGAADPEVDAAVMEAVRRGSMSTLNCPEEVELAELLLELHPWAEKARFCRTGGEAMAIAIRIARASTGRDKVAFCGYHGWHDWYLSANLRNDGALDAHLLPGLSSRGVAQGLEGSAFPFYYNRIEELQKIVSDHGDDLAAIVMEPIRGEDPKEGFLEEVRKIADQKGAVLIFDECSAGFRLCGGGAHLKLGVDPDMAMFAKAMSNGYAMAAIIGKGEVMTAAEGSFISSSYWTERVGPAAAVATIRKYLRERVELHQDAIGRKAQSGWKELAERAGLPIKVGGIPPLSHIAIDHEERLAAKTLVSQLMLERGYLVGGSFYPTLSHTEPLVDEYLSVLEGVFGEVAQALERGEVKARLKGPVVHSGFHRLVQ